MSKNIDIVKEKIEEVAGEPVVITTIVVKGEETINVEGCAMICIGIDPSEDKKGKCVETTLTIVGNFGIERALAAVQALHMAQQQLIKNVVKNFGQAAIDDLLGMSMSSKEKPAEGCCCEPTKESK